MISKDQPSNRILVAHFGNGDEDDQTLITDYCHKFGAVKRITVFPGMSYGHIEYADAEGAMRMMADFDGENIKLLQ